MGKTTEVAADRAYDQTKTVMPKEVAQGVYMQHAPSLAALKLMHLMIGTAGGRTGRLSDGPRPNQNLSQDFGATAHQTKQAFCRYWDVGLRGTTKYHKGMKFASKHLCASPVSQML